jgi:phage baseplate assembly protein V
MFDIDNAYSASKVSNGIRARIYRVIGRALLTAIKNSGKTQVIQVKGFDKETITDIERFQEYGFESYPKKDSESLIIFPGGNRDQGCVICVMDTRYRPTDLSDGDVCVYNLNSNQRVWLKADGSTKITNKEAKAYIELNTDNTIHAEDGNGNILKSTTTQWDLNGNLTVDI